MPEIEEREAALLSGHRWRTWLRLDRGDRVDGVAHFRIHRLLELVRSEMEAEQAERESRRAGVGAP